MTDSEQKIDRDLQSIIGSFAIEGVALDDEQVTRCRTILSGDVDCDDVVDQLFEEFRAKTSKNVTKREAG